MSANRHIERISQHNYTMVLSDFLEAASRSLGDMSPMLVSAISSKEWLKRLTSHWATLTYKGKSDMDGRSVNKIAGQYREEATSEPSGEFEAYVTDDGEFLKYVLLQRLSFPKVSKDPIEVVTVWESNLKEGATTNPVLYKAIPATRGL
jgi:hypothetical protein